MFSISTGSRLWRNHQEDRRSFEQPENPREGKHCNYMYLLQFHMLIQGHKEPNPP